LPRGFFLTPAGVLGLGAFVVVPYLAMGTHDMLYPSPEVSKWGTAFFVWVMIWLFLAASFMA
jgi:hypothetical protein